MSSHEASATIRAGAAAAPPASSRARQGGWAILLIVGLVTVGPFLLETGSDRELSTGGGDLLRQALYVAALAYVLISQRVFYHPGKLRVLPLSLTLLLVWCLCSVAWAIDPGISLRRITLTIIVIVTVFLAVEAAGTQRALAVLRWSLAAVLVLNYIMVLVSSSGVHTTAGFDPSLAGNWRGLMLHKNTAGVACAFTVLLWLFTGERGATRWIVIAAAAFFLYQTQSKTSLGALGVSIVFGLIFAVLSARPRLFAVLVGFVALMLAMLAGQEYLGELSRYFSQPDAFTGRAQIWKFVWTYSMSNPVLGSGYGSFWDIGPASPIFQYTRNWVVFISTAHSGYLDVLAQIGLPGLLLALAAILIVPGWQLLTSRGWPRGTGAFLAGALTFCAVHNVTETSFLERDHVAWVLLAFVLAMIATQHRLALREGH